MKQKWNHFPKKTHDTNVDISNDKHFPKGSSRMAWHCLNVLYFDSFMRFSIWWLHTLNYNGESVESFIWTKNSVIHAMKTGALQLPVLHVIKTSHHCAFHKFSWLCNQYPGIPWKNNEFPRVTTRLHFTRAMPRSLGRAPEVLKSIFLFRAQNRPSPTSNRPSPHI